MTSSSSNRITWAKSDPSDPAKTIQYWPCRCGVEHSTYEEFLSHEALAPYLSTQAATLRQRTLEYLDRKISHQEWRVLVLDGHHNELDEELVSLSHSIEWMLLDYERGDLDPEAIRRNLHMLVGAPVLRWMPPCGASYEPGEHGLRSIDKINRIAKITWEIKRYLFGELNLQEFIATAQWLATETAQDEAERLEILDKVQCLIGAQAIGALSEHAMQDNLRDLLKRQPPLAGSDT